MKQVLFFLGRVLLFCLPQTVISTVAILAYVRAGIVPPYSAGAHVCMILTVNIVYFSIWGLLDKQTGGKDRPWRQRLFALTGFLKGMMINLVYVASYTSHGLWGEYITWANLRALGPHLRGFHLALGAGFIVSLGVIGIALTAYLVLRIRISGTVLRWLRATYAGPAAALHGLLLAGLCAALGANFWFRDPLWHQMAERDPILAFWTNQTAAEPALTAEMLADRTAGQAYRVPETFRRRNVLIFAIDCLRADHLSFRGYPRDTTPFLTSLHRAGRLQAVDFAVSNGNDSPQGIRAILNSRLPHRHNLQNFRLQDLLKQAGYRTHVLGTGDHTTLGSMRMHYGPNVDVFLDGLTTREFSVNDDRGLLESLAKIAPAGDQPAFFYFHLMSAHELGVRDPAFARWQPATLTMDWHTIITRRPDPRQTVNTYDNGVLQADHHLREIFAELEKKGYLRDYIAVITGDHGQGLGEYGHYGHTEFLRSVDVNVPILFMDSEAADYGPMPFASHIDIAPTLLDRLGLPRPERWQGRSLFRTTPPSATYLIGKHKEGWKGVMLRRDDAIYKYLLKGRQRNSFTEELYEVTADPTEARNLAAEPNPGELLLELRQMAANEFGRPVPPLN